MTALLTSMALAGAVAYAGIVPDRGLPVRQSQATPSGITGKISATPAKMMRKK